MKDFIRSFLEPLALPTFPVSQDAAFWDVGVGDISGSMSSEAFVPGESKRQTMEKAITSFLDEKVKMRPEDYFALIAYHHAATVCCPFLNVRRGHRNLHHALKKMTSLPAGGTTLASGLTEADMLIARIPRAQQILPRVLAYSDGYDDSPHQALKTAEKLKNAGVIIETFGVEISPEKVDEPFLKEVATTDGNGFVHYRFLRDAQSIQETFNELALGTLTVE